MFHIRFQDNCSFRICLCRQDRFTVTFGNVIKIPDVDYYEGPYEVTPTEETQILQTIGLLMRENVTVNPIPTNYGRITWNGTTITVS